MLKTLNPSYLLNYFVVLGFSMPLCVYNAVIIHMHSDIPAIDCDRTLQKDIKRGLDLKLERSLCKSAVVKATFVTMRAPPSLQAMAADVLMNVMRFLRPPDIFSFSLVRFVVIVLKC